MKRLLLLTPALLMGLSLFAGTITVKNVTELHQADKNAKPGDVIILANGEWKDAMLRLGSKGTKEKPITFIAQTPGQVLITGHSNLKIGGQYLIIKGLQFLNGFAGTNAVIEFRLNKDQLANNCRVTECSINEFNNVKRMNENYWISFYGKNNRLDHSYFRNKKNMGVLIAVILDDERSRENHHSIDNNLFDGRPPLASNSGEIIRVGVSQHCQFNSFTNITDNYFKECDGETEIVSIKSGGNIVKNNLFRECQGGVVLRHGDNNTVENNIFLGNYKDGTGGVRVINKGQWVVNNFFFACRGVDFRSPLSVMNGIPNSPAHRYVQVTDAVIANNTFYNCSAASFCEGSDAERTLPPDNVYFANNIFYNTKDTNIYRVSDNMSGFAFSSNTASSAIAQALPAGFVKAAIQAASNNIAPLPAQISKKSAAVPDSIQKVALNRLGHKLPAAVGFGNKGTLQSVYQNAVTASGPVWLRASAKGRWTGMQVPVAECSSAEEVYAAIGRKEPIIIKLTGKEYMLDRPFTIQSHVTFDGNKATIRFSTPAIPAVFMVNGGGHLLLYNLMAEGSNVKAKSFICSDTSGPSNHYNIEMRASGVQGFDRMRGCESIFFSHKSTVADSVIFAGNSFSDNNADIIVMAEEKDDKGYYNAEKILIGQNQLKNINGVLLNVYRGGNDESTMGPKLIFENNTIEACKTPGSQPLISLTGVQQTKVISNTFKNANPQGVVLGYKDIVRARHLLEGNSFKDSGKVAENGFVENRDKAN
ncbi:polysaccharide lyase 6 family protein [Terrimonas sp. NA20]|uniref:Polysaccharide lyase 6 family protein n=1 Tax=Terrimonas ginsenosidimutans TaxID=2908004 RepID=A0ABS9L074_9BACT|nr:polysaccharide lyase 6 family protein [Terrimonas ginsenosidimutans]MCG2617974.1 polysaccharide lyase 6 family protein [Terrimonas ginsenosidimutans]